MTENQNLGEALAAEDVVEGIADLTRRLRKIEAEAEQLVGGGVSLGGHVRGGKVVLSYNLGWAEGVALQEDLHHALSEDSPRQVAVIVENNANSFAAALNPRGGRAEWRAVVIVDQRGIGCGLFLNGELWRGGHGKAGELGHVPMPLALTSHGCKCGEDGPYQEGCRFSCRCGKHGCLETISTLQAITRAVQDDTEDTVSVNTIKDAAQLLEQGDPTAHRAFEFAGKALGYALANLALTLDPARVRLHGYDTLVDRATQTGEVYLGAMDRILDRHGFSQPNVHVEAHPHGSADSIQDDAAAAIAGDVVQRFLADQI